MEWKKLIPKCFSSDYYKYAQHQETAGAARKMIFLAIEEGAQWYEVEQEIISFLQLQKTVPEYIEEQLEFARSIETYF